MNQQHQHKLSIQRKGPWLIYEEIFLHELVNEYGNDWSLIASKLETRTAHDCKIKYVELSKSSITQKNRFQQNNFNNATSSITPVIVIPSNSRPINRNPRMNLQYIMN
ncbi:hypothetical protein GLOIN_2v1523181 [Rhizophagus clarus]|uniref:Myb-like domain-containing protein n=1 Tax=Rhizophagus clarus TaxID=94130 RepID=A0A8H3LM88_9GLOM|nr:hypothetical protein GLOIN_2v1523181 [Rhizophagus clarus]